MQALDMARAALYFSCEDSSGITGASLVVDGGVHCRRRVGDLWPHALHGGVNLMYSVGMTFKLKPGAYPQYKKAHDELWPEIAQKLRDGQVSMAIYSYQDRLFLHAVAPSREHFARSQEGGEVARWHAYMATLMVTDQSGKTIVEELEEAFSFGMFRGEG
jgi:L-rhamnose mutarotase